MPRFYVCTLLLVLLGVAQQALACRYGSCCSSRHQEVVKGFPSFEDPWARHDDTDGGLENDTKLNYQFQNEDVVVVNNLDNDTDGTVQVTGNEKTADEPKKKGEKLRTGEAMKVLSEESQQEPVKIELTEKITQTLPGNKTKEVLVNEKEEKLSSGETIKEVSLTRKNVTDKDLNITDIEEETFIAQKVAKGDSHFIKEEEKSSGEVVSVEKEEKVLEKVVPSANEEKPVEKVVPSSGQQDVQKGKERIVEKTASSLEEIVKANLTEKLRVFEMEKVAPSVNESVGSVPETITKKDTVTEGKTAEKNGSENTGENIAEKIVQSIKKEEEKVVPLRKEIEGVAENLTPAVKETETKGNVTEEVPVGDVKKRESLGNETLSPVPGEGEWENNTSKKDIATGEKTTDKDGFNITEEKAGETVAPSTEETEEKSVPVSKGGARVENITPVVTENATEGNVSEKAPVVQEVISTVWPANETVDSVPKGEEKSNKTMVEREIVTEEKVTDKDGSVVKKEKVVEKVAPSAKEKEEKIVPVLKGGVVEKLPPASTENTTEGYGSEKTAVVEGIEKTDPFINEMVGSVPEGERDNKTMAKKEIIKEKKVSDKDGLIIKEEMVAENETMSNLSKTVPAAPELKSIVPPVNEIISSVPRGEENGNKTMAKQEIATHEKLTSKNASIIRAEKAEQVAPSVNEREEKVILIPKQEGRVVEKIVPVVKENATMENVTENVPLVQVITVCAVPMGEKEENKTKAKREIVTMEKVTNKEKKVVEKAAPSAMQKGEKVFPVLRGEAVGNKTPVVTGNTIAGNVSEKVPVVQEGNTLVWPVNGTVSSVPNGGEKENKTMEERAIVTETKVTDNDGSVIKEESVVEEVASSVKET